MPTNDLSQILSPPSNRTLADEVIDRLRMAILSGELEPGERLRDKVLAKSLGVSGGPVRVALRRLEREGLVLMHPNRRAYVARLSREDLEEVYSVRNALERLAVDYACRNATAEDLDALRAVVDTMESAMHSGTSEQEAAALDIEFHNILYRSGRHQRLWSFWTILRPQVHVFLLSRNVANADFREKAVAGHRQIMEAIADQDQDRALSTIDEHISFAYERVLRTYRKAGDENG